MLLKTITIFILAAIFEIIGCYLLWQWVNQQKSIFYALLGVLFLAFYGLIATFQTAEFVKVYVAYGGIFIVISYLWAFFFNHYQFTSYDIVGMLFILIGIFIIYFLPKRW